MGTVVLWMRGVWGDGGADEKRWERTSVLGRGRCAEVVKTILGGWVVLFGLVWVTVQGCKVCLFVAESGVLCSARFGVE